MKTISRSAQLIAYETIREKIITGAFPGGMKLVEIQLAEEIGISRTPVREAIRRLEQDGLIKRKKVFKPSKTDFHHMFEMKMLIECYAAKKAAANMPEERIEKLRTCIQLAQMSEPEGIVEANNKFHTLIVEECRNPIIVETFNKMQSNIYLFSKTLALHKSPVLIEEHIKICDAIEQRLPELASMLMEEHLKNDLEFTLSIVK